MTLQYIIVFLILATAVGWMAYKLLFKKGGEKSSGCCGCSLSEKCSKPKKDKGKDCC